MEQNLVSDEELIKRINDVLNDSKEKYVEEQLENSSVEKFHDVSDSIEIRNSECGLDTGRLPQGKDLELENQILASQLEAERKKSRELQSKFQLFENSVKYFERLNGQLETIKQTVEEDGLVLNNRGDCGLRNSEAMQKLRPKTVHTAANGIGGGRDDADDGAAISSEPQSECSKEEKPHCRSRRQDNREGREEIAFRDVEDFKQLEQDLEIVRDKEGGNDSEAEKVFITKTEKKCFEDIGNLASRMRTPLDDKHQKFFEKDRRRFANRIVMPETQELDKAESVPPDLVSKTKETPVNITSTELDGLRSYLLQLKELIARRETAWARTTERDYNQRVEITRFKNEVSHLRMLCEKRQKDLKEKDQIIVAKEEEIKELQKRVQGLKNAVLKLEKKEARMNEAMDEVSDNTQLIHKSFNVMKRASLANKGLVGSLVGGKNVTRLTSSGGKEGKRSKPGQDWKMFSTSSNSNEEEVSQSRIKSKMKTLEKSQRYKHKSEGVHAQRKSSIERVDEKLQRIEEMLHSDVLRGEDKRPGHKQAKKADEKKCVSLKGAGEVDPVFQKFTPSNSKMRQEMLGAMTGITANPNSPQKPGSLTDPKKHQGNASILANALLAARNTNMFNF